jgi:ribosomal protein S18 acetylase RimI-like enzyme
MKVETTMDIRKYTADDLEQVVELVARLNARPEHHVCYLGTEVDEIRDAFLNDLPDLPADEVVVVAAEGDRLIGVWGLEVDAARGRAYQWGPFVDHPEWQNVANRLWDKLLEIRPAGTNDFRTGVADENTRFLKFADEHKFELSDKQHYTMELKRPAFTPSSSDGVIALPEAETEKFAALHDAIFPDTYYNGREIVARICDTRKVFVTEDTCGYIYIELKPDLGFASLEFIGVGEGGRGKGYGSALLLKGCDWTFSHPRVDSLQLNVASDNSAVRLYRKHGFEIKRKILALSLDLASATV